MSLLARSRRLANVEVTVTAPRRPNIPNALARIERTGWFALRRECRCGRPSSLPEHGDPLRSARAVPDRPGSFVGDRGTRVALHHRPPCREREHPGVVAGLDSWRVGRTALRRVRRDEPRIPVAHLSFPAPRGEIASDEKQARNLRAHRVLCCARASTTIDRLDAYCCTNCGGSARLKTDSSRMWQECSNCGHADRDLVLSLTGLRTADVRVLFADYRIAKYLSRGRGRRYAGAFGRSVRCGNCYGLQTAYASTAPWDRAELRGLLAAIASTWNSGDPTSSLRRAAYLAARRAHRSRPNDLLRLEDALRRLLDAGVVHDGRVVDPLQLEKLDAGLSLCCGRPVVWSNRRAACVFLDIEELISFEGPASSHPDLAFGQTGVRQILTLSE